MLPTSQTKVEQIQTHARVISALVPSSLLKTKFLLEIVLPARPERMESRQSCLYPTTTLPIATDQLDDSPFLRHRRLYLLVPSKTLTPVRPFWINMAVMAIMAKRPLFSSVVSFNLRSAGSWQVGSGYVPLNPACLMGILWDPHFMLYGLVESSHNWVVKYTVIPSIYPKLTTSFLIPLSQPESFCPSSRCQSFLAPHTCHMQILQEIGPAKKTKMFGENQWVISRNTISHSVVSIEFNFKAKASEDMNVCSRPSS